jgi:hypothetical protein
VSSLFGSQSVASYDRPAASGFPFKAVASGLRLLALIGFVMPFATVSCGGQDLITINGLQASFGTDYYVMGQAGHADGLPFFALALALIVGALVIGLLRSSQVGRLVSDQQLNVAAIGLGILATAIFVLAASTASQSSSQAGGQGASAGGTVLTFRWDFGFWLSLLAILLSTALAAVGAFPQQFGLARLNIGMPQRVAVVAAPGGPPGPLAIGTLSSDGLRFWNGATWVDVDDTPGQATIVIGTLSSDGSRFWNGAEWAVVE